MASDGGRRKGEDETVIVMSDRRTLVNGSTANGAGWAIFAGWCSGAEGGRLTAAFIVKCAEGDDWLEEECRDREDVDADLVVAWEMRRACVVEAKNARAGVVAMVGFALAMLHGGRMPGSGRGNGAIAGDTAALPGLLLVGLVELGTAGGGGPGGRWEGDQWQAMGCEEG